MRIALVFKRFARSGGSERQLAMLCRYLASCGDEVHVFSASVRSEPEDGVELHRMPSLPLGHTVQLLAFSRWARSAIRRHESKYGSFDIRHAFGRTVGQDVYRLGGGSHRTYLEVAHALDRSLSLRPLLAGTPYQRLKAAMEERAILASTTRAIFVNSAMVRDDLARRYGLGSRLVHVVRNGVDLELFRPPGPGERAQARADLSLSRDAEVALFVGSGYARKGLEQALRAVSSLADTRPRLQLLIAGHDANPRHWERLAERLGCGSRVRFLGSRGDPEWLFRAADVYLLPTAYDASANTTLEALASGLPVITSTLDGAGEIIAAGRTGSVLATPVCPADVAAELNRWLDRVGDPEIARVTRAKAECYPADFAARETRRLYARLVAQPVAMSV